MPLFCDRRVSSVPQGYVTSHRGRVLGIRLRWISAQPEAPLTGVPRRRSKLPKTKE